MNRKRFCRQVYNLPSWVVFVLKIVANFVSNFFNVSIALLTNANASLMSSWFVPMVELWAMFKFFGLSFLVCNLLFWRESPPMLLLLNVLVVVVEMGKGLGVLVLGKVWLQLGPKASLLPSK